MKKLITLFVVLVLTNTAFAEAEIKEVCHDKLDKTGQVVKGKDGKVAQDCKKIKVHKKLEGTTIPDGKKK